MNQKETLLITNPIHGTSKIKAEFKKQLKLHDVLFE